MPGAVYWYFSHTKKKANISIVIQFCYHFLRNHPNLTFGPSFESTDSLLSIGIKNSKIGEYGACVRLILVIMIFWLSKYLYMLYSRCSNSKIVCHDMVCVCVYICDMWSMLCMFYFCMYVCLSSRQKSLQTHLKYLGNRLFDKKRRNKNKNTIKNK